MRMIRTQFKSAITCGTCRYWLAHNATRCLEKRRQYTRHRQTSPFWITFG